MTDYTRSATLIAAAEPPRVAAILRSLCVSNPEVRRYVEMTLAPEPDDDGRCCSECGSVGPCACFDGEDWL